MEPWLTRDLVCPRDHLELSAFNNDLLCPEGHRYAVVDGVPVMLIENLPETIGLLEKSIQRARDGGRRADSFYLDTLGIDEEEKRGILRLASMGNGKVDPVVSFLVGATNGIAYKSLVGKLAAYPIPTLPLPPGEGKTLLDIGCSWGRWCIAAARQGYRPLGVDPSLGAIMAARRVARELDVEAKYVVGDARLLPLKGGSVDSVFSYSVLQHFSRSHVAQAAEEIGRVLVPSGNSLIQMPTRFGLRCLYHQVRMGFREGQGFDVRYWSLPSLGKVFGTAIGPTRFSADCFFGIGLQGADRHLLPASLSAVVACSEILRHACRFFPALRWIADSIYVSSSKPSLESAGRIPPPRHSRPIVAH